MSFFRTILSISFMGIRKWMINSRIYILSLLIFIILYNRCREIAEYSNIVGVDATPWIMPFIFNYPYTKLALSFGIVLLFCDAPFIDITQPYVIIRSNKNKWAAGQILYICISSFIYYAYIILLSIVLLIPNITFHSDWGKVIYTIAHTSRIPFFSEIIIHNYTPYAAMLHTYLLNVSAGITIGLIIFTLNLRFSRATGAIAGVFVILFSVVAYGKASWLSPLTLTNLTFLDSRGLTDNPSHLYAYCFFIIVNIILGILAVKSALAQEINTMPNI